MSIIDKFIEYVGYDKYIEVKEYIETNKLLDEFRGVIINNNNLFEFSVRYGIIEIVKFLYEHIGVTYNLNNITDYNIRIEGREANPNMASVNSDSGGNVGMNIAITDKYTRKRNECMRYLIEMRKKSKMYSKNGQFYYSINKRYVN
ncbi:hypothetical protein QKU48_gp0415 [Fadolivirus algeromassiliense]|jgi:hypothetical protein|uniref:Uncharacterized protein n=1 Tax=Fadolivirus FV1/VV64 TaxID=3070911 RepID=A0A7D3UQK4_9VIRU|nr:hypothetical protein QKU48_gp0415 [Fadolivirus algeromassiliense]QKF93873.1 hypothetical protein Fadolivirus_1_415 [Fadolivirus FV1/VV64]